MASGVCLQHWVLFCPNQHPITLGYMLQYGFSRILEIGLCHIVGRCMVPAVQPRIPKRPSGARRKVRAV